MRFKHFVNAFCIACGIQCEFLYANVYVYEQNDGGKKNASSLSLFLFRLSDHRENLEISFLPFEINCVHFVFCMSMYLHRIKSRIFILLFFCSIPISAEDD